MSVVGYHAEVLSACAVLAETGELVTPAGFQRLYTSNVADDELVLLVLEETAVADSDRQ